MSFAVAVLLEKTPEQGPGARPECLSYLCLRGAISATASKMNTQGMVDKLTDLLILA